MHTFVAGSNNGITAVLTESDYMLMQEGYALQHGFFLFTPDETTHVEPWFHGTRSQMDALLAESPVRYVDLYVPFSNGAQLYANHDPSGRTLIEQLEKVASWPDMLRVFGPNAWQVYYDAKVGALAG